MVDKTGTVIEVEILWDADLLLLPEGVPAVVGVGISRSVWADLDAVRNALQEP